MMGGIIPVAIPLNEKQVFMRIQDLDLKKILEIKPDGSGVQFAGRRALILDATSQGLLRQELIETFSEKTARGILCHCGFIDGMHLAEILKNKFTWDSVDDWRKAGPRLLALQGYFIPSPNGLDTFGAKGGSWRGSYEAEQHLVLKGRSENPVCWNLCGLISGYLSFVLGHEVYALEDKCVGKGDTICHAIIKSEEGWGREKESELAFFKRVEIDNVLRNDTATLKNAKNRLLQKTSLAGKMVEPEVDTLDPMVGSPKMPLVSDLGEPRFLKDVDKDCILRVLGKTNGNRQKAADLLGIGVATLYRKLKAYRQDETKD